MDKLEQLKQDIVTQSLALSSEKGWQDYAMSELFQRCQTDSILFRSLVKDKKDVFRLLCISMRNFVENNSEGDKETYDNMSIKDILFDKIMLHFDFLEMHKKNLDSLEKFILCHPDYGLIFLSFLPDIDFDTKNTILINSIPYIKPSGNRIALALVFLYSFKAWKTDSSNDLSKTMTAVDKALNFILRSE